LNANKILPNHTAKPTDRSKDEPRYHSVKKKSIGDAVEPIEGTGDIGGHQEKRVGGRFQKFRARMAAAGATERDTGV
jgi:hypothetical protein